MQNKSSLKKSITFIEAMAIVVGMIIGSGIFLKPGIVLSNAGTPTMSILAWVVGGVITLASALSVAEIAALFQNRAACTPILVNYTGAYMATYWDGFRRLSLIQPQLPH